MDTPDPFDDVDTELTPSERLALVYIRVHGPIHQVDLREQCILADGSTTNAITGLLEAGRIKRLESIDLTPGQSSPWLFDPDYTDAPDPLARSRSK